MPGALRRLRRRVITGALVLAAGLDAALGLLAVDERKAALADAERTTRALATTIEQHATDIVSSMDQVLSGVGEVMAARPEPFRMDSHQLRALLERRLPYAPNVNSLFVVDATGQRLMGTNIETVQQVDVRDRMYFHPHAQAGGRGLVLEGPLKSRVSGKWILVASRRLENEEGRFAGVAAATIEPEGLRAFYERADLGAGGGILLLTEGGTVVARHPDHDRYIGTSIAGTSAFELTRGTEAGTLEATSPLDGTERVVSYKRSPQYGLIAVVSLGKEEILARWRTSAWSYGIIALLANVAIALATAVIYRQLRARARTVLDLRATAERLSTALDAANQANHAKLQFLANMSHELRTPLNAIIGFSDVMLHGVMGRIGNPRYESYVNDIHRSARHLLSLINDILDVSRSEAGKYVLRPEPCSIPEVAEECLAQVRGRADQAGIAVESRLGPALPTLLADAKGLRQMLLNLLANAIKFTDRGGTVAVIATTLPGGGIALSVSDTGIGIAPEDVDHIFEPFQQVDSSHTRRYDGVGLGLPIVRAIARHHGADVTIASAVGEGTTITISFPASATERASEASPLAPEPRQEVEA